MCGLSISNDVDVSLFLQAFASYDAIGICLLIVSGHRILRILLGHKLIKVWILLVVFVVVLHVSAPYNNTDFTFVLKSLILVWIDRSLAVQIFFRSMKAVLALLILILTSASVPPSLSTMLPRYVNVSISSSALPSSMIGVVLTVFTFNYLLFPLWVFRPSFFLILIEKTF